MKDKNIDLILQDALKANYEPNRELNDKLIAELEARSENPSVAVDRQKPAFSVRTLARIAAAFVIVAMVGTVGVVAANHFLKKPTVTDHRISVGNEDYIDEEEIAKPAEEVPEESISSQEGGPDDRWLKKEVTLTNGAYRHTDYTYPDYESAVADTEMPNLFSTQIGEAESVVYSETEEVKDGTPVEGGYRSYELNSSFRVNEGSVFVLQSYADGIADDSAYVIPISNRNNERDYTSKNGLDFTLVDEEPAETDGVVRTVVMIAYDKYTGYIMFEGLSEDEIHTVLDRVVISPSEEAPAESAEEPKAKEEDVETAMETDILSEEEQLAILNQDKALITELDAYLHEVYYKVYDETAYELFRDAKLESVIVDYQKFAEEETAVREYTMKYTLKDGGCIYLKGHGNRDAEDIPLSGATILQISEEDYKLAESWISYSAEHKDDADFNWHEIGNGIYMRDASELAEGQELELMYMIK